MASNPTMRIITIIHVRRKEADMRLQGKVALITGGNSGIGRAATKQFVNEGAYVYISGRRDTELAEAVKEIGENVTGIQGDVVEPRRS
jgi:NAD(P)-dependent dehydrogenase (short-subunit alcohol dehydrogenase family)